MSRQNWDYRWQQVPKRGASACVSACASACMCECMCVQLITVKKFGGGGGDDDDDDDDDVADAGAFSDSFW